MWLFIHFLRRLNFHYRILLVLLDLIHLTVLVHFLLGRRLNNILTQIRFQTTLDPQIPRVSSQVAQFWVFDLQQSIKELVYNLELHDRFFLLYLRRFSRRKLLPNIRELDDLRRLQLTWIILNHYSWLNNWTLADNTSLSV